MERRPDWLKVKLPGAGRYAEVRRRLEQLRLHTVCDEARCPNVAECWGCGTATFMILGKVCTRGCRFCDVTSGHPPLAPDDDEPRRVAAAVAAMGLRYAVITSVDRDDLPDGGAAHFVRVVEALLGGAELEREPTLTVELLTPDFQGDATAIELVGRSGAQVIGHNIETVRRLTPELRDRRCDYQRSLQVLAAYRALDATRVVKSSLLLGLGESADEVRLTLDDLRRVGVDWVTLGQYLQPSRKHAAVQRFVPPAEFEELAAEARERGFALVSAGPLVRSSYRAGEASVAALVAQRAAKDLNKVAIPGAGK